MNAAEQNRHEFHIREAIRSISYLLRWHDCHPHAVQRISDHLEQAEEHLQNALAVLTALKG